MKLQNAFFLLFFLTATKAQSATVPDWLLNPEVFPAQATVSPDGKSIEISNGLLRRSFTLKPDVATVALDNQKTGESLLRSVRPEAWVEINGNRFNLGGLTGQPAHNFLKPSWLDSMKSDPLAWHCTGYKIGRTQERFRWKPHPEWLSTKPLWPPPGVSLTFEYLPPAGDSKRSSPNDSQAGSVLEGVKIQIHYELYDGLPLLGKWITISNQSPQAITVNSFLAEQLAVVEPESIVDGSISNFRGELRRLEVFSDFSFGGNMTGNADGPAVRWKSDPLYPTQVHYEKQTPCLLECMPPFGPQMLISAGESFDTFRVFELVHDSDDRERRGLALRQAYRTMAPWTQENPVLMHVRNARPEAVKTAIDQSADVGFEMVIMTFGSGFNIENEKPEYRASIKELASYASSRGVVLGGYSLLASRTINAETDVINPKTGKTGGARFGNSPCLGSQWGEDYFRKLRQFFEQTGCAVLEHDGSYPGDVCASTKHPGHRGLEDSQWMQWLTIRNFYQWCRGRGIYLNVPDWYYLNGSNKCAMGYRETNWSLPREEQEIIERQNVYDGTWEKAPSMGWMFVPLVEYQGGGAAATIEPLCDHLDHYETRLANLFGAGVQACYRGPRLYDTPQTRTVVKRWVDFYREHRPILDSDLIHLRRADGRDWDGWLHANPRLKECGLAMFYNPLPKSIERAIRLSLYYTGLTESALIIRENGSRETIPLDRDYFATVSIKIPASSRTRLVLEKP